MSYILNYKNEKDSLRSLFHKMLVAGNVLTMGSIHAIFVAGKVTATGAPGYDGVSNVISSPIDSPY